MLTDQELTNLIREVAEIVCQGDIPEAESQVQRLKNAGIVAGVNVGKKDMNNREILEWYAGQFIEITENKSWFAMNSWLNCVDKFAPVM